MKNWIVIMCLFWASLPSKSASIQLNWSGKEDITIIGYYLHFGCESGVEVYERLNKVNQYVVTTLEEGKIYWFQVTPIHSTGKSFKSPTVKGTPSDIIRYKVPTVEIQKFQTKPSLKIIPILK